MAQNSEPGPPSLLSLYYTHKGGPRSILVRGWPSPPSLGWSLWVDRCLWHIVSLRSITMVLRDPLPPPYGSCYKSAMVHYNTTHREYDVAFSALELQRLRKIREHPDGEYHKVTRHSKTGQFIYPWKRMKEGDFFLIPVTEDNIRAKRIQMTQMARRLDIEIAMSRTKHQGELMLRVTYTYFGLKRIRSLAKLYHGKSGQISDGRWQKRRQRYRNKGKQA